MLLVQFVVFIKIAIKFSCIGYYKICFLGQQVVVVNTTFLLIMFLSCFYKVFCHPKCLYLHENMDDHFIFVK